MFFVDVKREDVESKVNVFVDVKKEEVESKVNSCVGVKCAFWYVELIRRK